MDNALHDLSPAIVNSCVFAVIPCTGSMRDWSLTGAANTALVAANEWVVKNNVLHLRCGWNATNNYAYDVRQSLDGDAWTCFASGNPFALGPYQVFIRGYDGVGQKFSWKYDTGVGKLRVWNGTIHSDVELSLTDHMSVATCSAVNGTPDTYVDGVFFGAHNLAITLSPITQDLRTNYSDFAGTAGQDITSLLMFDRQLSTQEILQLHSWSRKLKTPALHQRTAGFPPVIGIENNLRGIWDFGRLDGGAVRDFARTPHHGTVTGGVTTTTEAIGKAAEFDGSTGYVTVGATGTTCKTFELIAWLPVLTDQKIIDLDGGTRVIEFIGGVFTATGFTVPTVWLDGVAAGTGVRINQPYHVIITTGTGVSVSNLLMGKVGANFFGGTIKAFTMFEDEKDASWIARRYRQFARIPTHSSDPDHWYVSFANRTTGALENTAYTISSGTWKVVDDGDGKAISCIATGTLTKTEATGHGGSLQIRRAATEHNLLYDAADATSVSLITGDKLGAHNVTVKPVHQQRPERRWTWRTTDTTQSWTICVTNNKAYWIDWGDDTLESFTGNGADQVVAHNYAAPGFYTIAMAIDNFVDLIRVMNNDNSLIGYVPDLSNATALTRFLIHVNQLTSTLPSLKNNTALTHFRVDNNSLSGTLPDLTTNAALVQFYVHTNGFTGPLPYIADKTSLLDFQAQGNNLTGTLPRLPAAIQNFLCSANQLTGLIPDISNATWLYFYIVNNNQLTGTIPNLSTLTHLQYFNVSSNQLTGTIPSLTNNVGLISFQTQSNQLTGYTASTIVTTCVTFRADDNALDLDSVDQILSDFTDNAAARPLTGTINISGGTNAVPTPAIKAACETALKTGPWNWTITTN